MFYLWAYLGFFFCCCCLLMFSVSYFFLILSLLFLASKMRTLMITDAITMNTAAILPLSSPQVSNHIILFLHFFCTCIFHAHTSSCMICLLHFCDSAYRIAFFFVCCYCFRKKIKPQINLILNNVSFLPAYLIMYIWRCYVQIFLGLMTIGTSKTRMLFPVWFTKSTTPSRRTRILWCGALASRFVNL